MTDLAQLKELGAEQIARSIELQRAKVWAVVKAARAALTPATGA